jgi:hypothetical protein
LSRFPRHEAHHVRRERGQFHRLFAVTHGIGIPLAKINPHIAALGPAQLLQLLLKSRDTLPQIRIVRSDRAEYADPPHALALLRWCRERPRNGRPAHQL